MEKLKDETGDKEDKSHKVSIHKVQCSTNWGSRKRTEKIQKSQYFFLKMKKIQKDTAATLKGPLNIIIVLLSIDSRSTPKVEGTRSKTYYYCRHEKSNRKPKINNIITNIGRKNGRKFEQCFNKLNPQYSEQENINN